MEHIPKVIIRLIKPENQRHFESGDWFYDAEDDVATVFISRMEDWRSELAAAIHEVVELVMCLDVDVDQTDVDFFDKKFYQEHDEGDAGDDKNAPYFLQHLSATFIEKEVCAQTKLSWADHEKNCKS